MPAKKTPRFDLSHYASVARVFSDCLAYSLAVGLLAHVLDSKTPFALMMICSLCFGFSEIIPVQVYALKARGIPRKLAWVAFGMLIGTCAVYAVTERVFGLKFQVEDLADCVAGGMFFGIIYLGLATFRRKQARMRRALERVAARKKLAEEALELNRYRLLAAQIKPHFTFNTLANVLALMKTDVARAEQLLASLTDHLHNVLDFSSRTTVVLSDEVETAKVYLYIQRERFPKLTFDFDVPPEMAGVRIPPLVLLTLVENAIHHGLGSRAGAGHISVRGEISGAQCHILVIDDGAGLKTDSASPATPGNGRKQTSWVSAPGGVRTHGMGLDNVRGRIAALHGAGSCDVSLHPRGDGRQGCVAKVTLPFAKSEARDR